MIKKFSAQYAPVRFNKLKSLSVGHLILLKDIGSVKSMLSHLVAYVHCKSLIREEVGVQPYTGK